MNSCRPAFDRAVFVLIETVDGVDDRLLPSTGGLEIVVVNRGLAEVAPEAFNTLCQRPETPLGGILE